MCMCMYSMNERLPTIQLPTKRSTRQPSAAAPARTRRFDEGPWAAGAPTKGRGRCSEGQKVGAQNSRTATGSTEGLGRVQSGYLPTDWCGGFSLFRFRPDALPRFLDNLESRASA